MLIPNMFSMGYYDCFGWSIDVEMNQNSSNSQCLPHRGVSESVWTYMKSGIHGGHALNHYVLFFVLRERCSTPRRSRQAIGATSLEKVFSNVSIGTWSHQPPDHRISEERCRRVIMSASTLQWPLVRVLAFILWTPLIHASRVLGASAWRMCIISRTPLPANRCRRTPHAAARSEVVAFHECFRLCSNSRSEYGRSKVSYASERIRIISQSWVIAQ